VNGESDGGAPEIDYRINFDQAIGSYIIRASGIATKSYTTTGLTAGLTYKFKVEARNSFDYSAYSQEISIICATIPSIPATPTTSNINANILVDWVAPSNNGLVINSYSVLIQKSDSLWSENTAFCNGAQTSIVSATSCYIPISAL
jgi:hypothetical protein